MQSGRRLGRPARVCLFALGGRSVSQAIGNEGFLFGSSEDGQLLVRQLLAVVSGFLRDSQSRGHQHARSQKNDADHYSFPFHLITPPLATTRHSGVPLASLAASGAPTAAFLWFTRREA